MDEIYTYIVKLPRGIDEVVMPCADGHTVYLSDRLDSAERYRKYIHAEKHIKNRDWEKADVQGIEHAYAT